MKSFEDCKNLHSDVVRRIVKLLGKILTGEQCDQMVRLFLNIWPFAIVKISPIMSQICQSQLSILPNMK